MFQEVKTRAETTDNPGLPVVSILLIEDNLGDARLIREMLKDAPACDWRVVQVDRLESGVELLSTQHFDLCLLDLNLPDSDGETTLHQLAQFFDLPILVLTGLDDEAVGVRALKAGAQDYIIKGSVDAQSLSRALRYALERYRLEQRAGKIFNHSNDAIMLIDSASNILLEVNPKTLLLLGYGLDELVGKSLNELILDETAWRSFLNRVIKRKNDKSSELSFRAKSNKEIFVEVSASLISEADKTLIVAVIRDITEKRYLLKELFQQAHHDALTGLANKVQLEKDVARACTLARARGAAAFALISLDMRDFKRVNDSLGHAAGDELLVQIAGRLNRIVRGKDCLARTGGDEFTILTYNGRTRSPEGVAERVLDALSVPFRVDGKTLHMGASIGVAPFDGEGKDNKQMFTELFRRADQAMYRAKEQGGGLVFYDEQTNDVLKERLWLERALHTALEDETLELYYQPLVSLTRSSAPHAEVLLRWIHPQQGFISPEKFIGAAERGGLIADLDRYVFRKGLKQAALDGFSVAINISPLSLTDNFADWAADCLQSSGLAPERITLELTERVLATPSTSLPVIERLSALGMHIIVDDFGTGYSSLEYLFHYPLNGLKVDRSFIANLIQDERAELIARTIVQLANNLGIHAIAEGIEEEAQLDWARAVGCDMAQGYLLGKPMPLKDFLAWLAANTRPTSSLTDSQAMPVQELI